MTATRWGFGLGTLGRDMLANLVSLYLLYYLTDVLHISGAYLAAVTVVLVAMRVFDAVNDPAMGVVVDNTRTRWGKFRPWILVGAVLWAGAGLLMFTDLGLEGWGFIAVFTLVYLVYEIAYTINDIAYWSMLPSLTQDQKERERVGVVARICANVGMFAMVVALVPATSALEHALGSAQLAWFAVAAVVVVLMLAFQSLTLFFAREQVSPGNQQTPLRELFRVIVRNDQLMWVTLAMVAFMTGYGTTASFGLYYFKYAFGDEGVYPVFAAILGVSQITALALFPLVSRFLPRRRIHLVATAMCVAGYLVFLVSGASLALVAVAGVLLFAGQGAIQLLMVMFIADSVEYGQWKLGRRNESVTFSLQPFIYKLSNAIASGVVGATLIWSGIDVAESAADVTPSGLGILRTAMLILPMALVTVSYLVLRAKYKIDEDTYAGIVADLERSGDGADH